ncbi:MAG: hypothetical protein HWE24_15580 [Oceanospirillaceae bacterium]|nr:hypothetical protein [Oceanospirillaceae bacterium]
MSTDLGSAKEMLADAKTLLEELEASAASFFQSRPYKTVIEYNSKNGSDTHKIKLTQQVPGQFRSKARHIASDIRGSLDHVGYAAALSSGKNKPRKTMFPFAKSEDEESNVRKQNCKDLPSEIFNEFWSFKPFIGGDSILWSLNEIANCNKHRSIVPVGHGLSGGQMVRNFHCDGLCHEMAFPPRWDINNNEAVICVVDSRATTTYDMQLGFNLCFGEIEVIQGRPVIDTLKYLLKKAEEIVERAELKGKEIGLF